MGSKRQVLVFLDAEQLAEYACRKWAEIAGEMIGLGRIFNVAVSGGKTPRLFYQKLASRADSLPWGQTHLFWADERFVPPDDEASNYRLVKKILLGKVPIPPGQVHPAPTALSTAPAAAEHYEERLRSHFRLRPGEFPAFDLIILGLGADGHTASLFPGRPALKEKERLVVAEPSPPVPPARITLTLPVLNRTAHLLFLVSGEEKSRILRRVVEEGDLDLPAALVEPAEGELIFAVDAAAAAALSPPSPCFNLPPRNFKK